MLTPSSSAGTVTCNQFNPTLGTLYRYAIVAFDANTGPSLGLAGSSVTLQNNSASTFTLLANQPFARYLFSYTGFPGQSGFGFPTELRVATGVSIPAGGSQTVAIGLAQPPIGRTGQTASLSSYIGTSTFNASYNISSPDLLPGIAVTDYSIVSNGSIMIVYEFNEVPEPGAIMMMAGGLLAVAAMTRRKRSR